MYTITIDIYEEPKGHWQVAIHDSAIVGDSCIFSNVKSSSTKRAAMKVAVKALENYPGTAQWRRTHEGNDDLM